MTQAVESMDTTLLVGRLQAAALCGISAAAWDRLNAAGKVPRPIKLGARVVWKRSDLQTWVELDCPDRETFMQLVRNPRRVSDGR